MQEYGIDTDGFTDISDSELDQLLTDVETENPNIGEVMLQGHLLHMGIKVPRAKLRSAIHRTDHANTIRRHSHIINRRVYSTPHPNAVWHIDRNHKLIRWRLVIHAGRGWLLLLCCTHKMCKQQLCNYSFGSISGRCVSVS